MTRKRTYRFIFFPSGYKQDRTSDAIADLYSRHDSTKKIKHVINWRKSVTLFVKIGRTVKDGYHFNGYSMNFTDKYFRGIGRAASNIMC